MDSQNRNSIKFALSQPHATYSAYTHGLISKWTYIMRTFPNIGYLLAWNVMRKPSILSLYQLNQVRNPKQYG